MNVPMSDRERLARICDELAEGADERAQFQHVLDTKDWLEHAVVNETKAKDMRTIAAILRAPEQQAVEVSEPERLLRDLVNALDRCEPAINSAFVMRQIHGGGDYSGPTYNEVIRIDRLPDDGRADRWEMTWKDSSGNECAKSCRSEWEAGESVKLILAGEVPYLGAEHPRAPAAPLLDGLDLDAIEKRCAAATPGPWQYTIRATDGSVHVGNARIGHTLIDEQYPAKLSGADVEFICSAREDIPKLCAALRKTMRTTTQEIK